jgi:hypothetical protein
MKKDAHKTQAQKPQKTKTNQEVRDRKASIHLYLPTYLPWLSRAPTKALAMPSTCNQTF